MTKNINKLVKRLIEESLQEKADELTDKVKSKVNDDWHPNEPVTLSGTGMTEEDNEEMGSDFDEDACGYHMEKFGKDDERTKRFCKSSDMGDIDEELIGGQKKLDKNKNGRLDKQDFKMLRKKSVKEQGHTAMTDEPTQWDDNEWETRYGKGAEEIDISDEGEMGRGRDIEDIEFEDIPRKKSSSFFDKMKKKLGLGEEMDEEVEEGNAFTGALAKTKKGDKFNLGGKSYTDRSNLEEAEKFIKKVYEGVKHKKSTKGSFKLTENEMIDLIEKIVMEQKKAKGMAETEKVLSANKKENEEAIKAVTKKMKEYLKDGSKGEYSMEPKIFPKGNGELAKMDKKAYIPSDAVDEYIDAFAYPGQQNLVFDEIKPDDEKIKKYIKGDKTTGNSQEYANAVKTDVGEKFYKNYENNLYGQEQMNASYKRQTQPVDVAGEKKQKGSLSSIKKGKKTAQSVLDKVDESEVKSEKLISEEFDKIKHLMDYNKKTQ
jgi:hypothetical protein